MTAQAAVGLPPDDRARRLAAEFQRLEPKLADLQRMARIAHQKVHEAIGETQFSKDGAVIGHDLTGETVELAMFTVDLVHKMIERVNEEYQQACAKARCAS